MSVVAAPTEFSAAIADAERILSLQRRSLDALGLSAPTTLSGDAVHRLSVGGRDWRQRGADLLMVCLAEIAARQKVLDEAVGRVVSSEITAGALTHAMHRIRTSIDVALGCSEEAKELSNEPAVQLAAAESAAALRLIYHYTNELRDLSSLRALMADEELAPVNCSRLLDRLVRQLSHVARDAKVEFRRLPSNDAISTLTREALLNRALSYALLNAVVSPGVTQVSYNVRMTDSVQFSISHNGRSATLEERASIASVPTTSGAETGDRQDASGFAVVSRLAKALDGQLCLETHPRDGDTLILSLPVL